MFDELKNFNGKIIVNGRNYTKDTLPNFENFEELDIYLEPAEEVVLDVDKNKYYEFTVKEDMTEFGKGQKNFHKKWNNGIAMPYRRMRGRIIEELDSMIKISVKKINVSWEGYILKDFIDSIEEIKNE